MQCMPFVNHPRPMIAYLERITAIDLALTSATTLNNLQSRSWQPPRAPVIDCLIGVPNGVTDLRQD